MRDIDLTLRSVLSRQDYPSPLKSEKLEKMVNEDYEEPGVVYGNYINSTTATASPIFQVVQSNNPWAPPTLNLTGWNTPANNTATTITANDNTWNNNNLVVNGTLFNQTITTATTNVYTYNNGWFNEPIVEKDERIKDLLKFLVDDEDSIESEIVILKIVAHEKIEELKYRRCSICGELLFENPLAAQMVRYHDLCDDCLQERMGYKEYENQDFFGDTRDTSDDRFEIPRWGDDWRREFSPAA